MVTPYLQETVIWGCFVPVALLSLFIAIIAIAHFRSFYRSLDILLISLVVGLLICVVVLFPMTMAVVINGLVWSEVLCKIFTFTFICTRTVGIISLISISVDGVLMLRVPGRYRIYGIIRSKTIHFVILGFWLLGIIVGVLPIVIWGGHDYVTSENQCLFLPYEISDSFAIILAVSEFAGITVSIICVIDAFFYLRHVKSVDEFENDLNKTEKPPLLEEKKNKNNRRRNYELLRALDFTESAKDCWAVTFAVVLISYMISHIPFMLLCVIGVVLPYLVDHVTAVVCMLWLILLEAIIIPALLWIVSVRYRHAHYYQVMTIICGCQFKTKDEYCDLQQQHRDAHQSQYSTYTFQRPAKHMSYYSSNDSLQQSPSKHDPNSPYVIRASKHDSEEQEISLYLSQGRKEGFKNKGFVFDDDVIDGDDVMDGERIEPDENGIVRVLVTPEPVPDYSNSPAFVKKRTQAKVDVVKKDDVIIEHYENKIVYKSPMHSPNVNKVLVNTRADRGETSLQRDVVQRNYNRNTAYSPYSSRESTLDSRDYNGDYRKNYSGYSTLESGKDRNSGYGSRESTLDRETRNGPFVLDSSALMSDLENWSDRSSSSEFRQEAGNDHESLGDSEIESILGMTGPRKVKETFYFNSLERTAPSVTSGSLDRRPPRQQRDKTPNQNTAENPNFEMGKANSRVIDRNFEIRNNDFAVQSDAKNYKYDWEKAEKTLSIMEFLMTKDDPAHAHSDTGTMRQDEEVSVFL